MPQIPEQGQTIAVTPVTGVKEVKSLISEKSYILYYRYGNIPQLKKVFYFSGDIKDAIARARMHCIKMGYTFILVKHFIEDLDLQEKMKTEKPEEYVENTLR